MCNIICENEKGISLVEAIVSLMLLSIGLLAVFSLQPLALKTSAKADYYGRAVMVLNRELTTQEAWIMNPCNTVTVGTASNTIYSSYQSAAQNGDIAFTVSTNTSLVANTTNRWEVTVTVSWPPVNSKGITDHLMVTPQENFRFGCI